MRRPPARALTRAVAILCAALFVAAIVAPVASQLLRVTPKVALQEDPPRPLPDPAASLNDLFQFFKILRRDWLGQTFGLRPLLVRWGNILDVLWLHSSTPWGPVLAGKDGWLYLARERPYLNVMDDYRVTAKLTPQEVETWVAVFTARRDWLAKRGIPYMVVVVPNKANVYPEFIPGRFNRIHRHTKLDQMLAALTDAGVDAVDLRPAVLEAKNHGPGYYRTDSHWTPLGAFFGYARVVDRLKKYFPAMQPAPLENFTLTAKPGLQSGLPRMLALDGFYHEDEMFLTPKIPFRAKEVAGENVLLNQYQPLAVFEVSDPALPRAVIFRDSFAQGMADFLKEHFSRTCLVWPYPTDAGRVREFDTETILKEKPDIVIDQFVERYFTLPPPPSALTTLPTS